MISTGKVPEGFSAGVITLIYKKGDKRDIKNYRPITLLNTDYKILAKIIANRMKEVAGDAVRSLQAYGIPSRDITDSIIMIQAAIRAMGKEGGFLLNLDLEKAFDRVDHEFMFKVLTSMGFGDTFIKMVSLLYLDAKSKIKINGRVSSEFRISL